MGDFSQSTIGTTSTIQSQWCCPMISHEWFTTRISLTIKSDSLSLNPSAQSQGIWCEASKTSPEVAPFWYTYAYSIYSTSFGLRQALSTSANATEIHVTAKPIVIVTSIKHFSTKELHFPGGAIAGIVIGVILIVVLSVYFCCLRHCLARRKKRTKAAMVVDDLRDVGQADTDGESQRHPMEVGRSATPPPAYELSELHPPTGNGFPGYQQHQTNS